MKPEHGPRARTRKLMVTTASRLMQSGLTPSVSEVAEAAEVSRATAYRYFPNQAALVHAVVDEALGPILKWKGKTQDAEQRILDLFDKALPRISEFEATFKAALRLSLEQWAQDGTPGVELYTVLKDIWQLSDTQSSQVAKWAACALVRSAIADAVNEGRTPTGI